MSKHKWDQPDKNGEDSVCIKCRLVRRWANRLDPKDSNRFLYSFDYFRNGQNIGNKPGPCLGQIITTASKT